MLGTTCHCSLFNKQRKKRALQCVKRTLLHEFHRQHHRIEPLLQQLLRRRLQRNRLCVQQCYLRLTPQPRPDHTFPGMIVLPLEPHDVIRLDFDRILRSTSRPNRTGRRSPPITIFPFSTYTSFFRLQQKHPFPAVTYSLQDIGSYARSPR